MKNQKIKKMLVSSMLLGAYYVSNAQTTSSEGGVYNTPVSNDSGVIIRSNDNDSNHKEYIRFFLGNQGIDNFAAEMRPEGFFYNGKFVGSNAISGTTPITFGSNRGLVIHANMDNVTANEPIKFKVGNTEVALVDVDQVFKINKLGAFTDSKITVANPLVFESSGASARIGLGLASPEQALHIRNGNFRLDDGQMQSWGPLVFRPDIDATGDDEIKFNNSANVKMASLQDGTLSLERQDNTGGTISSSQELILKSAATGANARFSFVNASNAEMARLQNGTFTTNNVRLHVTTFPDYVFEKDYNLMPLAEVASYIQKNKHLPGIPSATEVIANGMDVKEINIKLVEKIEELTLYTISQEEKLKKQEVVLHTLLEKINQLEKQLK
ncbi:MAG: hypothetical protein QM535_08495 [Limnohabitans sp.]|nr:hypothetical protein [Limnohabitans sp.]